MKVLTFNKRFLAVLVTMLMCMSALAVTKTVTYTVESTSVVSVSGEAPLGSSAMFSSTSSNTNRYDLTSGNSMTLTLKGFKGVRLTNLSIFICSNSSSGSGYLSVKSGSTSLYTIGTSNRGVSFNDAKWNGSYSSDYTNVSKQITTEHIVSDSEDVTIIIGATANSLHCKSFTLTYDEVSVFVPVSISLSGDFKTTYNVYDEFSSEGITVTARNSDNASLDVTSFCSYSGYHMDEVGSQTVTVNCKGITATYNIVLRPSNPYHDVLKYTSFDLLSTNDKSFVNKMPDNGLGNVYAGNAAKNENTIQLGARTNLSFRYIANTQSCGYARSIKVKWSSTLNSSSSGHVLKVYGQNDPYSAAMSDVSGKYINTMTFNGEWESYLNLGCQYPYLMIVSQEGVCYLDEIEIEWLPNPYTRFMSVGRLGTICLPYNVGNVLGASVYEIAGKVTDKDGVPTKIYFTEATLPLVAGRPYLFRATESKQVFEMTGTTVASTSTTAKNGLYGVFEDYSFTSITEGDQYYIVNSNNEIQRASSQSGVYANRAYIKMDEVPLYNPSNSKERLLVLDENGYSFEEATDIDDIIHITDLRAEEIYTLGGVRTNVLQKGVNIIRMSDGSVKKVLNR